MKNILLSLSLILTLTSCALRSPVQGLLWTDVQSGVAATPQIGPRVGRACSKTYLGLVAMGDSSIEAARLAGGITSISSVDEESKSVFILFGSHCTIVRGK